MLARVCPTPSTVEHRRIIEKGSLRPVLMLAGALFLASSTTGCAEFPVDADYLEPFAPPPVYRQWWLEVERCAGLDGDFREIRWYAGESVRVDGEDMFGFWAAPRTIVLERFYTTSPPVVKHEMLHHLTRGEMSHAHPAFRLCASNGPTITTP